jgi:hypothetical protein
VELDRSEAIDWENEARKRKLWNETNGYWPSYLGGLDIHCGKCAHRKNGRCEVIPCLVNRVDLFSGCRLKATAHSGEVGELLIFL